MKCPNCGTEIKDGNLYCEKCGEEIHIVPDFEPEIEYSMNKTLSGIVEDVLEEVPTEPLGGPDNESDGHNRKHRKGIVIACLIVAVAIAVGAGTGAVLVHQNSSISYQISKANACLASGNIEKAITYYVKAVALDPTNISLQLTLADLYDKAGMEQEYLSCLTSVIGSAYISEDEMESAYKKLIAFYKSREDYASINTLLVNTDSEAIRTMFQHYMAAPPEFSYKEGTYAEVVPLKLTASTQGTIYYTMDGTIPDLNSEVYTSPIFLETGSYTISAMFVNEYGIESEVVAKSYVIDVLKPTAPEVETYSGEYTTPSMIRVLVPTGCTVYYTTDGQVPTDQSAIYVSEIPMPLGKSTFKFVTYSKEGVAGAVTTRHFDLKLATDFTADMAVSRLVEVMVENGRITDASGTIAGDLNGRYLYNFQYALAIPNEGDFYVISEVYEDSAGVQNKTGTTYAVNAYTQEYYKLSRDALDGYILETF